MTARLEGADFGDRLGDKFVYQLPPVEFQLQCLSSNSLAGDSTGLRVYSGSHVAIRQLIHFPEFVQGKRVVELGSGTGVFGILGCHFSLPTKLVLTDGEERSLAIIQQNIEYYRQFIPSVMIVTTCNVLKWGDQKDILKTLQFSSAPPSSIEQEYFDVVIGCELMYFNTDVDNFISTVMALTNKNGLFIHAHVFRAPGQEQQLIDCLAAHNWASLEIPHKEFISTHELGQHIEWRRVRPLISAPVSVIQELAILHPTWFVFQEEIVYEESDVEDEDDDDEENPTLSAAALAALFS